MEFIASHATQGYLSRTDGGNVKPVGYHNASYVRYCAT
jgi:hypothetical protein